MVARQPYLNSPDYDDVAKAAERSVASLMRFLESLRTNGYQIDGRQMVQAQRLILGARAAGKDAYIARRLKYLLAPILTASPAQQTDFCRRYDR